MKPVRIQRRRTKGFKMPANTIYVGRPTKWGNPFDTASYRAVILFRDLMEGGSDRIMERHHPTKHYSLGDFVLAQKLDAVRASIIKALPELRGKNLACWCGLDRACHADVLLQLANGDTYA
jgi:Domain of unknown function (DUF4326)